MQDLINILLVDDEPRNLDTLEAVLEDPGYRLLRASDADSALHFLLQHDVAAIVLDIKMPGVSGFELAGIIKGTKRFRQIPIVFLTAYAVDDQDVATGYGAGAVDYLTKPVKPVILRHKVAVFADLFRKTRALAELNETLEERVQQRTAELEASKAALVQANAQKDRFLATLAHELRNPLAPLRTGLDLILKDPERPASLDRPLAVMNRQVDHMVRLIDDLLDVSRITRGSLELRRSRGDLADVIAHAVETAETDVAKRSQKLVVDVEGPLEATVDTTRIAQIVANLLHNASKHSPPGAAIHVAVRRAADAAVVEVIDQGAGIPQDQLARVFDAFTKIERSVQHTNDGLGIGLALSRQLAELHGGTLSASSAGEGKGATFTLRVPLGAGEPVDRNTPSSAAYPAARPAVEAVAAHPLRVVVIEDNEDAAEMLAEWLQAFGCDVEVAHAGDEGVALVKRAAPDVVLCDLGLPGIDGVEVCRRVLHDLAKPPVMVALTGWGMAEDRRRTVEAGFKHHLVKPVDLDKLRTLLEGLRTSEPAEANKARA